MQADTHSLRSPIEAVSGGVKLTPKKVNNALTNLGVKSENGPEFIATAVNVGTDRGADALHHTG